MRYCFNFYFSLFDNNFLTTVFRKGCLDQVPFLYGNWIEKRIKPFLIGLKSYCFCINYLFWLTT